MTQASPQQKIGPWWGVVKDNMTHSKERRKNRKLDIAIAILSVVIAGISTAIIIGGGTFITASYARESTQNEKLLHVEEYIDNHTIEYKILNNMMQKAVANQIHIMKQLDRIENK